MIFREHRGSLNDSMKTRVVLPDRATLIEHCRQVLSCWPTAPKVDDSTLWVHIYTDLPDDRTGWIKTYMVGVYGYGVVGFTDGPADEKP
jgi:hypothetical protein